MPFSEDLPGESFSGLGRTQAFFGGEGRDAKCVAPSLLGLNAVGVSDPQTSLPFRTIAPPETGDIVVRFCGPASWALLGESVANGRYRRVMTRKPC